MRRENATVIACCALALCVAGLGSWSMQAQSNRAQNAALNLDHGWQFRQVTPGAQDAESGWLPATVPGDVHLDLLANKKIPDPFYRDNEARLQWIENESWEYRLNFDVTPALLARSNVDLVFDGLDAAAEVYLNGDQVLNADNSFRIWRMPVKPICMPAKISCALSFLRRSKPRQQLRPLTRGSRRPRPIPRHTSAKPPMNTDGTGVRALSPAASGVRCASRRGTRSRIADFAIRQRDVSREVAHLDAEVEVEASSAGPAKVTVQYFDARQARDTQHAASDFTRATTSSIFPSRFASRNSGIPPATATSRSTSSLRKLSAGVGSRRPARRSKTGLRSIVLRPPARPMGPLVSNFVVNGIPVFAKGADVIPFDSFPNRVTTADYRRILESARDANMNMIRHWGGGYYETDEFYQICDELGIMVWQDFMFGNDWQPGTYAFKQNIEAEAEDQVRRLRNHPSIVLWCGNNETEEALRLGAQRQAAAGCEVPDVAGLSDRIQRHPATAWWRALSRRSPYWPSSPSSDYEELSDHYQSGDAHIWDVWHGRVPFSTYETHHPRFVTEYGFQSFPEMRTIEAFTQPEDRTSIFTPVMLAHQKNNEGNSIIHDYLLRDYPEPKDFASFLYVSQVLQAEGIKIGAEHFRRSRPETMGSIFWQLNDCWPVASWSSIDYYGRWKALQYYARRFYAPILVSPHVEDGSVRVYIVSDKTAAQPATLRVRLMDFDGKVLLEDSRDVSVDPLASKVYLDWPLEKLTAGRRGRHIARLCRCRSDRRARTQISRNLTYLAPTKEVHLNPAQLDC